MSWRARTRRRTVTGAYRSMHSTDPLLASALGSKTPPPRSGNCTGADQRLCTGSECVSEDSARVCGPPGRGSYRSMDAPIAHLAQKGRLKALPRVSGNCSKLKTRVKKQQCERTDAQTQTISTRKHLADDKTSRHTGLAAENASLQLKIENLQFERFCKIIKEVS